MTEAFHDLNEQELSGTVRLWVEDEASFGRISKPKHCWCPRKVRPVVKCQHVRQYCQCFGACEPLTGEKFFRVFEKCDADSMEIYLEHLAEEWPKDFHIVLCDCAGWHISGDLCIPQNVAIANIPPGTPEMNPMEQIWREIRTHGFHNQFFPSLESAISRLCDSICKLSPATVQSITARQSLLNCFY